MRTRLSRAVGMLCKIRHYVNFDTLKMVYHGIFSSILIYGSLIWGQHNRIVNRLQTIQNKAIRYMMFKPKQTAANPLFKAAGILNLHDFIKQQNCLYAYDCINRNLPTSLLDDRITFVSTSGNTRNERLNQLVNFRTSTILYGTNSIRSRAVQAWNEINIDLYHLSLQNSSKSVCKNKIAQYLLERYEDGNIIINNNNNNNNNNQNNNNNNRNNINAIPILRRGGNNYGRAVNWTGQRMVRW